MNTAKDVGRAGLVAVLIAAAVTAVAARAGKDDADVVTAQFASAAPLVEGNQVKIDGVVVGSVKSLKVVDGLAEVALELDDEARPLHEDARLTIRPVSLLGERYVDLDRGSPDAPLLDEDTVIPVAQTATSVGLDEALNTVDQPTGEGLRALLSTLGEGMQGNGENVDEALRLLSPSLKDTRAMAAVLDEHNELLSRLITNFEPVASALATRDGEAMDQLVDSSDKVLTAVRERQAKLEQTLDKLPGTLRVLRTTLGNLRSAADDTAPTLAELRPLTDKLPVLATELRAFSDALDPALATSEPVLRKADELLKAAAPVAADARRAGGGLATSTDGVQRLTKAITRNREDVFNYIRYWALTTNGYDGLSHYFRAHYVVDPDTILGLLPVAGTKPSAAKPKGSGTGDKPATPKSGGLLDGLDGVLGGLLQPKGDSATGLSEQQELDLLGLLLGGK
ncbi:phospholipid/cholesterol/gamma-HCH transport system substrate-binding protein [Nocardioides aromaticivorans]|uniref:Organic solvent ABC transporter substrate-binding protein n=1 Tax=Nocardioides aromaticivorans TaxID=200618 RepID=A0A7Z0CPX6_9ACTN|nr:MlaD family protein [Nocardioides aromaticivorans]NYI46247.1 phospholipid/cholesterol/gamma-HCH transport system substrate-binding protein [Nocardioides aromaticivorans]QSR25374.1 organic solvent ABC transporter substrate-binding protein [Nocardioides aromaticivorans]